MIQQTRSGEDGKSLKSSEPPVWSPCLAAGKVPALLACEMATWKQCVESRLWMINILVDIRSKDNLGRGLSLFVAIEAFGLQIGPAST